MSEIVYMKFGSHLYGTDTPESDLDFKGIFMPSKRDILLGRIPKTRRSSTGDDHQKNNPGDTDEEVFSLHYFIKLACEGQTVAIDMLHAPDNMILRKNSIWDKLISDRHLFYTKNLSAFVGYCRKQAAKYGIKGSRLDAARRALAIMEDNPKTKLRDMWDSLPDGEHIHRMDPNPEDKNNCRIYQVCGKKFLESVSGGNAAESLRKFVDEFGHRAELAAKNEGIDWKAVSHAMRAAFQIKEILTLGTINFPLKEAEYLKNIKQGKLDYLSHVAPTLETLIGQVEELSSKSQYPEEVDREYWDNWLLDVLNGEL